MRRLLNLAERFSWMKSPAPDLSISRYNQAGRQAALQGAREGMVLLKNEGGLLPLDGSKLKTIAVIGPNAFPRTATAGGSGPCAELQHRELSHRHQRQAGFARERDVCRRPPFAA